jgi:hypothetical protein
MKYSKTVNIGRMSPEQISKLPRGQWVKTSDDSAGASIGRLWGVRGSGVVVVAWQGNARGQRDYWGYQNALRHYARG